MRPEWTITHIQEVCAVDIIGLQQRSHAPTYLYLDDPEYHRSPAALSPASAKGAVMIESLDEWAKYVHVLASDYTASIFASLYSMSETLWPCDATGESIDAGAEARLSQAEAPAAADEDGDECKLALADAAEPRLYCDKIAVFKEKLAKVDIDASGEREDDRWEEIVSNSADGMVYKTWKKPHEGGPFMEYISSTVLFDANPVDLAMFIMDFRSRSKMDANTLDYMFVETRAVPAGCGMLADETLCVVTKFPMMLAPRRYVYERTSHAVGDEFFVVSTSVAVSDATRARLPYARQRVVDVTDFESVVCIRQVEHSGKKAVEVLMNYFEDPKLQPALCNLAAQASMWRLALEFHCNYRHYSCICDNSNLSSVLKQHASSSSKKLVDLCADGSVEKLVNDVNDMVDESTDDKLSRVDHGRKWGACVRALRVVAIAVVVMGSKR